MIKNEPKIVFWDLETLPDPRAAYERLPSIGAWPGRTFKAELHTIICFAYKIAGDSEAKSINSWDLGDTNDDSALVQMAYDILHDADEIVTHNGKQFDVKVLNTRLAHYGMPPIPKIPHVDTKVVAKSKLSLYSNSLADVAKFFRCDDKMHWSGKWSTWTRFAFGEDTREDRTQMDKYAKQDVEVLEQIYLKLRPFHGNVGVNKNHWVNEDELVCPTCGSTELTKNGVRRNQTQVYQRFLCGSCGSTCRTNTKGLNPRSI